MVNQKTYHIKNLAVIHLSLIFHLSSFCYETPEMLWCLISCSVQSITKIEYGGVAVGKRLQRSLLWDGQQDGEPQWLPVQVRKYQIKEMRCAQRNTKQVQISCSWLEAPLVRSTLHSVLWILSPAKPGKSDLICNTMISNHVTSLCSCFHWVFLLWIFFYVLSKHFSVSQHVDKWGRSQWF